MIPLYFKDGHDVYEYTSYDVEQALEYEKIYGRESVSGLDILRDYFE